MRVTSRKLERDHYCHERLNETHRSKIERNEKNYTQQTVQYENVTEVVQNVRLWLECMPSVLGLPLTGFRSVLSVSRSFLSK